MRPFYGERFTDMLKSPCPIGSVRRLGLIFGIIFAAALLLGTGGAFASDAEKFTPVSTAPLSFRAADPALDAPNALPLDASFAPDTSDDSDDSIDSLVADAGRLVAEKKWPEAKNLLEEGLKKNPDETRLRRLYLESRAHLEVVTRYADASFCEFLSQTDKDEILYLCDEVVRNIQTWHVDTPDWNVLFSLGMESLSVAFSEEAFLRRNRVGDTVRPQLAEYGVSLQQYARSFNVQTPQDLKESVFKIAETVQRNTGISGISVIMELLCGMVNSLDSYSAWLTGGQVTDVFSLIDGHFVGLGVYVDADSRPNALLLTKVIVHSPAEEAGLVAGDLILSVNGQNVTSEKASELLQGEEGSRAVLSVQSENQSPRNVTVIRRAFDFPSVENVQTIETESGVKVGTLKINTFQKTTVTEMREKIAEFQREKIDSMVIDLRNNPGGLLDKAIELSNLFLENGTIVRTRGRQSEQIRRADAREVCPLPLVILIDENSASAAEIFAGAIQENGRGVIVGKTSYGKGTIQAIIQLESRREPKLLAGLRLTTEKFYSPRGKAYSGVGVTPDIDLADEQAVSYLPAAYSGKETEPDRPMDRAVAEAEKIAPRRQTAPLSATAINR